MAIDDIDPKRLYSLTEAAAFVPSCVAGKRVHPKTLHRWRKEGRIKCQGRAAAGKTWWFVWGAELLRFLGAGELPEFNGRSPTQARREHQAALEDLRRRHGLPC
jgi:hypothetical protein